jgi:hypothetical protein
LVTTSSAEASQLVTFWTVPTSLRRAAAFHAKEWQLRLFLLLYLPPEWRFIVRGLNRRSGLVPGGPFGCVFERRPLN